MLILNVHIFQRGFDVFNAIFQASVYVTIVTTSVYYNSAIVRIIFRYFISSLLVNIY